MFVVDAHASDSFGDLDVTAILLTLSLLGICFFFTLLVNDLIDHHR